MSDILKEAHDTAEKIFRSWGPEHWRTDLSGRVLDAVYDAVRLDPRTEFVRYTAGALYAMVRALPAEQSQEAPPWTWDETELPFRGGPPPPSDLALAQVGERLRALPYGPDLRLYADASGYSARVVGHILYQRPSLSAAVEAALSAAEAMSGK